MLRYGSDNALHLFVFADEPGRIRRPQPEMQGDRSAPSAFACDRHATPESEVVPHVALAAVPDLGKVFHLLRIGLLHVGRVQDDQRVLSDFFRSLLRNGVVQVLFKPFCGEHPAEPVFDLFWGDVFLQCTDDGRELDVFLRHDPVDHVTDETCHRLVEMGRNPPQKRFELVEQFCSDCGIIHAVISLVCVSTSHYSEDHSGEVTFFVPPVRELCSARGCPASPKKIGA